MEQNKDIIIGGKGQSVYTGDESKEITRIYRQNQCLNRFVSVYLNDIFANYETPSVLDVGCADGANIMSRLEGRMYHSLLGIDRNKNKIEVANTIYKEEKNKFLCCDISTDEFYETLSVYLSETGRDGFDIIHISSVLLHIENPDIFLANIRPFLSENGCVFIQDEDDGLNYVYPHYELFDDCFYVWKHSIEAGDRFTGRKIPYFLINGGYSDVKVLSTNITSVDFNGELKDYIWDMYFNSDLWVADDVSFYDTPEGYERFLRYRMKHPALREAYMSGHLFIMLGVFFIVAKK